MCFQWRGAVSRGKRRKLWLCNAVNHRVKATEVGVEGERQAVAKLHCVVCRGTATAKAEEGRTLTEKFNHSHSAFLCVLCISCMK